MGANLVPFWGVLFGGWEAFHVVLLYWSENIVVGFYNVLKMVFAKVDEPHQHLGKLFLIPFLRSTMAGFVPVTDSLY